MATRTIFLPSLLAIILGAFYCAYTFNWILFRFPGYSKSDYHAPALATRKKLLQLHYWHHEKWCHESVELLWPDASADALKYLMNRWLSVLDEERAMNKKVTVQSVVITPSGKEVIISFDRNPLNKAGATMEKLLWIEGLLKTMRAADLQIQSVQFLVHHKPMHDYHLDFSNPWPITGFLH